MFTKVKENGKIFFNMRTVDIWNKLPNRIVTSIWLCSFKMKLDNLFGDNKCIMDREAMIAKILTSC